MKTNHTLRQALSAPLITRILSIVVLLSCCLALNAQIPNHPNKIDKKGLRQNKWVIWFDKNWNPTTLRDSLTYYRTLTYKDDKPIGPVTDYYLSGKKQYEGSLLQDRPVEIVDGKAVWYNENGTLAREAFFVKGKQEGLGTFYYESGKKYSEGQYKNGNAEGRFPYYDENGNIFKVEYYENGEQPKLQKIWDTAVALYNSNDYAKAEILFRDLYVIFCNNNGRDHGDNAYALNFLWMTQRFLKKPDEAFVSATEMCRVRELQKIAKDSTYRDWLYDMVAGFKELNRLELLEAPLLKVISIEKEIVGNYSTNLFTYRRLLGDYYRLMERFSEGESVFLSNIADLKKLFPNQPELYNYDMGALAYLYENTQEYAKAEQLYKDALASFNQRNDTTKTFATVLIQLRDLYQSQNKNLESIPIAQRLIELQKLRKGKNSREHAVALKELYKSYRELSQFELAETTLLEHHKIMQTLHGPASFSVRSVDFDFALLYDAGDDKVKGAQYYESAITAYKAAYSTQTTYDAISALAEVLAYAGDFYSANKNYIKAELYLSEAATLTQKIKENTEMRVAQIFEKIGTAQTRIKNFNDALDAYEAAYSIMQKLYSPAHYNNMVSGCNLALIHGYMKQFSRAEALLNEISKNVLKEYGTGSEAHIMILRNKANLYRQANDDEKEISARKEIATYTKQLFGESSLAYYREVSILTQAQSTKLFAKDAKESLKELEALFLKRNLKPTDADYQNFYTIKAACHFMNDEYEAALNTARIQLDIGKQIGNPTYGLVSYAFGALYMNQISESLKIYEQYINRIMDNVQKTFPYLSEAQKVAFYNAELEYHLDLYYFIALAEPLSLQFKKDTVGNSQAKALREKIIYVNHPNTKNIFNFQLQTKGILFESSQKVKQAILNSNDEPLIKLYNQWQAKKDEMNKVFLEPESRAKEEKKSYINQQIKLLEKELALKSRYFTQNSTTNYTWRDVQKKLKKDEALVEILAVSAGQKLKGEKYSDTYLALVITPETRDFPLLVRLGLGDSLEGKYARLYQNSIKFKFEEKVLYNKYWKKLADTLKNVKRIFFSPDGIYHKVNVNTLRNPVTGKYVLEEKEIRFISQSRDFITHKDASSKQPVKLVLFGSPNYNNAPASEKDKIEDRATPTLGTTLNAKVLEGDSVQRFFNGDAIAELPGTEMEIKNIAGIAQSEMFVVENFLHDAATEAQLKAVNSPTILHVATHGFFMREDAAALADERGGFANFTSNDLKNPLRRSGLLFSNCRQAFSREANKPTLEEDGILTADEAQNLSLDNTDMVVLSACETGLGEVRNGEGVYGLQRAFQTAGAQSVLMSLWTVSDQATQELMTTFYSLWFNLKDKRIAFREAQLHLKQKYPDPFYWGAFVLVGN